MVDRGRISLEQEALRAHISQLRAHHDELVAQSRKFQQAIEPLQGTWKGSSYGPWQQMTEQWRDAMEKVNQTLDELTQRVDSASSTYAQGEQEQADQIRSSFASMDMPTGQIL